MYNSISYSSRHLLFELKAIKEHCSQSEQKILLKVVQNNSFSAHPEHIILGMLGKLHIQKNEVPGHGNETAIMTDISNKNAKTQQNS